MQRTANCSTVKFADPRQPRWSQCHDHHILFRHDTDGVNIYCVHGTALEPVTRVQTERLTTENEGCESSLQLQLAHVLPSVYNLQPFLLILAWSSVLKHWYLYWYDIALDRLKHVAQILGNGALTSVALSQSPVVPKSKEAPDSKEEDHRHLLILGRQNGSADIYILRKSTPDGPMITDHKTIAAELLDGFPITAIDYLPQTEDDPRPGYNDSRIVLGTSNGTIKMFRIRVRAAVASVDLEVVEAQNLSLLARYKGNAIKSLNILRLNSGLVTAVVIGQDSDMKSMGHLKKRISANGEGARRPPNSSYVRLVELYANNRRKVLADIRISTEPCHIVKVHLALADSNSYRLVVLFRPADSPSNVYLAAWKVLPKHKAKLTAFQNFHGDAQCSIQDVYPLSEERFLAVDSEALFYMNGDDVHKTTFPPISFTDSVTVPPDYRTIVDNEDKNKDHQEPLAESEEPDLDPSSNLPVDTEVEISSTPENRQQLPHEILQSEHTVSTAISNIAIEPDSRFVYDITQKPNDTRPSPPAFDESNILEIGKSEFDIHSETDPLAGMDFQDDPIDNGYYDEELVSNEDSAIYPVDAEKELYDEGSEEYYEGGWLETQADEHSPDGCEEYYDAAAELQDACSEEGSEKFYDAVSYADCETEAGVTFNNTDNPDVISNMYQSHDSHKLSDTCSVADSHETLAPEIPEATIMLSDAKDATAAHTDSGTLCLEELLNKICDKIIDVDAEGMETGARHLGAAVTLLAGPEAGERKRSEDREGERDAKRSRSG